MFLSTRLIDEFLVALADVSLRSYKNVSKSSSFSQSGLTDKTIFLTSSLVLHKPSEINVSSISWRPTVPAYVVSSELKYSRIWLNCSLEKSI